MPAEQVTETETEEIVNPEAETTEEVVEDTGGEIQIGDRSFKTNEAALAYARESLQTLELDNVRADAFRQGIEQARPFVTPQQNVTQAAPTVEDPAAWEQEFYANPKATLAKIQQEAIAEAEKRVLGRVTAQSEDARLWNKFSEQNPDLADFKQDVEMMTAQHVETVQLLYKTKGEDEAMKFIAQKTKAKFQQYAEKAKPSRELPQRGQASPSGSGSGKNVTGKGAENNANKPLSFIDQIKQNKKRNA